MLTETLGNGYILRNGFSSFTKYEHCIENINII